MYLLLLLMVKIQTFKMGIDRHLVHCSNVRLIDYRSICGNDGPTPFQKCIHSLSHFAMPPTGENWYSIHSQDILNLLGNDGPWRRSQKESNLRAHVKPILSVQHFFTSGIENIYNQNSMKSNSWTAGKLILLLDVECQM